MTFYVHVHWFGRNRHALVFHGKDGEIALVKRVSQKDAEALIEAGANSGS